MSNTTHQISAAARSQVQAQLGLATSLADTLIDSMQKMIGLNLHAAKASLDTSMASTQQLLTARDPQEFFSLSTHQAQPHAEIALTYGRHLASIASGTQLELTRVAEDQVNRSSRQMVNLIDEFGRLAPAGSQSTLSFMKSAMDNVSASVGQLARNSKIAIETMEHNMKTGSEHAGQVLAKQGKTRRK